MNWFSEALSEAGLKPHDFARLTGWNYKSVLTWAKGNPIPTHIERRLEGAFRFIREGASPREALSGLKRKVAHRAPKSGKYVGPSVARKEMDRYLERYEQHRR